MSDDASTLPISAPKLALPPGACDSHAHVFGPFDRFPLAPGYEAPLAPAEAHQAMLDALGFSRAVIVQPSAYGLDNRATLNAVAQAPDARRAIGIVDADVSDATLTEMKAAGVRGMRYSEIISSKTGKRLGGVGFDALIAAADRLKAHGLHAQITCTVDIFVEAADALLASGIPLVLDHMSRFGPSAKTVDDAAFQRVIGLLKDGKIWVKMTAFRNSVRAPFYEDVRPFHDALLAANPDQLVWGTDWPLLNTGLFPPDIGHLLDLFDAWTPDPALGAKVLVDNPARLYGF
jgi:2-pyrone-4,6-dicarboxylate lactonase